MNEAGRSEYVRDDWEARYAAAVAEGETLSFSEWLRAEGWKQIQELRHMPVSPTVTPYDTER